MTLKEILIAGKLTISEGGGGGEGWSGQDIMTKAVSGDIVLDDTVTLLPEYSLYGFPHVKSVRGDAVTRINPNAFAGCTGLESAKFPNLSYFYAANAFLNCESLIMAAFPKIGVNVAIDYLANYVFMGCKALTAADIGHATRTGTSTFFGCTALKTLVMRHTSIVQLGNINVFTNTPFASGGTGGTIYIPESLYNHLGDGSASDYKAATNWSTVDGYGTITWAKIEGSAYENASVDGTPIA